MALSFNGTTINTITFNGNPLTSVTFNGTEVFGDWVEYTFPNSSAKLSAASGDGSLGFDLKVSTRKKWAKDNAGNIWYPLGDENSTELTLGFAEGNDGYSTFYWACRLPTEWGKAKVKSINIAKTKNYRVYSIVGGENRSAFDAITTAYNQTLDCTIFSRPSPTTDVTTYKAYAPTLATPTDPISVIKVQGTKASQDENGNTSYESFSAFPGRFTFTFLVSKAGLKEWAANYGVTLPFNIA